MNLPDFLKKLKVADGNEAIDLVEMLQAGKISGLAISPLDRLPLSPRYAWLIEIENTDGVFYRDIDDDGAPKWTSSTNEALQFSRRVDAEKFANGDEEDIRIVEHGFES